MGKVIQANIEIEEIEKYIAKNDKLATRKSVRRCPVFISKRRKIGKGTRYQNKCVYCKAVLAKELKCRHCHTSRVWRGPEGSFCNGCGREHVL